MKLSADGFELEDDFLYGMVSNSTSVGGFRFHEQLGVSMDDGVLELALVRFPKNLSEQQAVINALLKQEAVPGLVYLRRVSHLHIVSEVPVPWTLDGEFGGEVQELDVRCCPQALEILVPGEEPKAGAQA